MKEFKAHSLLKNPWLQTILPMFLPFKKPSVTPTQEIINLKDGEKLSIFTFKQKESLGHCLLVHGLSGNHESNYMYRVAHHLLQNSFNVTLINLRGAGTSKGLSTKPYHAGLSTDLEDCINQIYKKYKQKIIPIGFSLGANLVLKYMGSHKTPDHVLGSIAISPPCDLKESTLRMIKGVNKVFSKFFVYEIIKGFEENNFSLLNKKEIVKKYSLLEFDDKITAPIWNYRDAFHYYEENSSEQFLNNIKKKTYILSSLDDPVIKTLNTETHTNQNLFFTITSNGGHVGFMETFGQLNFRWLDQYILEKTKELIC
ncbi:MAG: putative alpha/beta-fold hydrolase [Thermoproteota archaeon]|jgi:predicted alpha/beta-fold hydrolase